MLLAFHFSHPFTIHQIVSLYAGHLQHPKTLEGILKNMIITDPMFPVPASVILGCCQFKGL